MLILVLFVPLLFATQVNSVCQQLAMMSCDDLNDYLNYESQQWRQLTVGHANEFNGEYILLDIWTDILQDLKQLELLTIQNLINETVREETEFRLEHDKLHFLNFYNNNIQVVYMENFGNMPQLIELNLVNNRIREIVGIDDRQKYTINSINFAKNQLERIRTNTFKSFSIKQLDLSNNRISDVQIGAFNRDLNILKLDHNQLTQLDDEIFKNLPYLKELSVSDNNLLTIGDLMPLNRIVERLDFAYNSIREIRTNFEQFNQLYRIDLSHNRLKRYDLNRLLPKNNRNKTISVAFNSLNYLTINPNDKYEASTNIILFGNPWICGCLKNMDDFFKANTITRTPCDMKLFGSGKFPYCVAGKSCENFNGNHTEIYENALQLSEDNYICDVDYDMLDLIRKNHRSLL